jgi:bifunctional DNA-binding transcriptional regulator/antitoxin component of YhaV-PrlF toxin-antitoxin module
MATGLTREGRRGTLPSMRRIKIKSPFNEQEATTTLDSAGRLSIPLKFRRKLRIGPGDEVRMTFDEDGLHVWSSSGKLRRIQAVGRVFVPAGMLVSEELIRDRRREAARE